MAVRVKICGLKSSEAVAAAVGAGADFFGFVFFQASPRHIEPAQAATLAAMLPDRSGAVALTVDACDDLIDEIAATVAPGFIQMHGTETPERVRAVTARTGIPVIKALAVAAPGDLAAAEAYEDAAAMVLFDARPPAGATRPGGHGRAFDWTIAAGYRGLMPWLLSGGLNPGNVAAAIRVSGAAAVDVSSGVERAPGDKDPALIGEFIAAARAAVSHAEERA